LAVGAAPPPASLAELINRGTDGRAADDSEIDLLAFGVQARLRAPACHVASADDPHDSPCVLPTDRRLAHPGTADLLAWACVLRI
jgi:hypothetical protein